MKSDTLKQFEHTTFSVFVFSQNRTCLLMDVVRSFHFQTIYTKNFKLHGILASDCICVLGHKSFILGQVVSILWVSYDVCPGFQSQGRSPGLCGSSSVCN